MNPSRPTRRDILLRTPLNRLRLTLRTPPLSRCIAALYRELAAAGIPFRPSCYLSNAWGCPDRVPLIGIPFYLSRADLSLLHREMGYDVEAPAVIMRLLRHEAGHAVCYAYRLYARADWRRVFGPFHKAYCDQYVPDPFSARHVVYGKHYYAQKHPDEDFSEAFAVWVDPASGWERRYAGTPAGEKVRFVRDLVRKACGGAPPVQGGRADAPVGRMRFTLLDYYGATPSEHRRQVSEYRDAILGRLCAAPRRAARGDDAARIMRRHAAAVIDRVAFWAGMPRRTVAALFRDLVRRAGQLGLRMPARNPSGALIDLASLLTFYTFTYAHTRRMPLR
ncbi:MAG: hypothetical protein WCP22_12520 [Chlamydiota bacterium]